MSKILKKGTLFIADDGCFYEVVCWDTYSPSSWWCRKFGTYDGALFLDEEIEGFLEKNKFDKSQVPKYVPYQEARYRRFN